MVLASSVANLGNLSMAGSINFGMSIPSKLLMKVKHFSSLNRATNLPRFSIACPKPFPELFALNAWIDENYPVCTNDSPLSDLFNLLRQAYSMARENKNINPRVDFIL